MILINSLIKLLLNFTKININFQPQILHTIKSNFYLAQLYESIFVYSQFLETSFRLSGNINIYKNGTYVRNQMLNQQIDGPFGKIALDSNNQRLAPFQAYIVNR